MNRVKTDKEVRLLVLLFAVTYMVSYITRINFGAVILEMVQDTGFSKSQLSAALTGSFITYGAGLLLSGLCGDRVQPKKLLMGGLLLTSAMNICIPFCKSVEWMVAVWCVNGLAQAFMWPPLVRLMVNLLPEQEYAHATMVVSWGSSVGTILIYLITPWLITLSGWRWVFWGAALCGLLMAVVWWCKCPRIAPEKPVKSLPDTAAKPTVRLWTPLIFAVMLAIVLQGALRDGVTTWMPSYISETYRLANGTAILTGVLMPLFTIFCHRTASWLHERLGKNPILCSVWMFGAGTVAALLLLAFTGRSVVGSVVCSALLTGCMHGANLMLICMVPSYFKSSGRVSTVSGILNACTYIGSALSTYGIARVAEGYGWLFTVGLWALIAAAGGVICLLCLPAWKHQYASQSEE